MRGKAQAGAREGVGPRVLRWLGREESPQMDLRQV